MKENICYEYWLANIKKLSDKKKHLLRMSAGSADELFHNPHIPTEVLLSLTDHDLDAIQESKKSWNPEREYEAFEKKGIRFLTYQDLEYPQKLKELSAPPYAVYVKGNLPDERLPAVAVVGARQCSAYGAYYAREFAGALGKLGVQIISGMAKGIDGISQRSAITAGGHSFGVLACGVDICYPKEHLGLYMDLQEHGGILSEQPLGTPPLTSHFPARNRIISGLADCVLVIEARERSGSLITADMALEQGKDVYALPGAVDNVLSHGCNRLIKQGAGVILSLEDLLEDLHIFCKQKINFLEENEIVLERNENMVYSCLGLQPKNISRLTDDVELPIPELMNVLLALELKGMVREISKNYYVRQK